ncbi:hypothetical protein ON010_g14934 [Phytophthora cinnamomi]|nr:hypothetical protein ON010_g14934 [Phytophthora cinnamomi]
MHLDGVDEGFEPRKKRRCRSSKKKRLRLKQRTSLEPQEHESQWDRSENNQPLEKETKSKNDNQVTEQTQHQDTQVEREDEHEGKERQEEEHDHDERLHNNDDGVTAYERKRRENILRNQVWMQQLGFSSAKLAIRTAICSEATKKETDEAKRQKAAEMQARRAAQLAERQTQPLRKSRRVQRTTEVMMDTRKSRRIQEMTEAMKVREARRVQFSRKLADNARSRRLRERNSQKLANLQEKSRIDNDNDESDTEDDGAVEDLADERSRKGSNIEGFTSENCTKEDKMKDPSYESGEYDSRPMALVQLASPPHRLLLEPEIQPSRVESPVQLQNLDSFGNRPPTEGNQHETNQVQTSSVLQDDGETQTHRSMTQTSKHEPLSDNSMLGDMAEFERKRRENILRNQSFMQLVGVSIAKLAARTPIGDGAGKEAKRQELAAKLELKAARKAELLNQPVRKSRRTIGPKVVLGHPTALSYSMELLAMKTRNRSNVNFMDAMDDDGQAFLKEMASNPKKQNALTTNSIDDAVEYSLAKDDVVKALPFRTTAMAFLPRADRILLACGDKEGHISLWSPSTRANESTLSSAVLCRPHGFTVSQIIFPDSSTLLSSSVDGTVRELDLHTTKSSLVCDICGEAGISSLIALNPQIYYAGCDDGSMRLIDRRARTMQSYELHEGAISTLDQHPSIP